jgi:hypothetical protein
VTGVTPVAGLWKFLQMVLAPVFPDLLEVLLHLLLPNEALDIHVRIRKSIVLIISNSVKYQFNQH